MSYLGTKPAAGGLAVPDGSVTLAKLAADAKFATGTAIMFQQSTAPTGWTKATTHDNKALRVVSGAVSSGGSVDFTTAFSSKSVSGTIGGTAITTAQMPAHNHGVSDPGHAHGVYDPGHAHGVYDPGHGHSINGGYTDIDQGLVGGGRGYTVQTLYTNGSGTSIGIYGAGTGIGIYGAGTSISINNNGSGAAHDHSFTGTAINMAVQYVDVIIATKD